MYREDYYKKFNWKKSPFIKSSSMGTPIIDRKTEYDKLQESIGGWDRLIVLTAPIGYGKTTFMNQLKKTPPKNIELIATFSSNPEIEFVITEIKNLFPFWKKLFQSKINPAGFGDYLTKMIGTNRLLLVFDEAQDYSTDLFKWLRMLNDRCENLFMLFIGLPGLTDKIAGETSLRDRKSKELMLKPLTSGDLINIIEKRIKWVDGRDCAPFDASGLKRLADSANTVPRSLMENGQKTIEYCAKKDIFEINSQVVEKALGQIPIKKQVIIDENREIEETSSKKVYSSTFMDELSPTQRDIIKLLLNRESLSISEISEELQKEIRSIGSLVRKLRGLNPQEVARKPQVPYPLVIQAGKEVRHGRLQYVFSLSDNTRRILAN